MTYQDLFRYKVIHGHSICGPVLDNVNIIEREIFIEDNIKIVTVVDISNYKSCITQHINLVNSKIHYLVVDKYVCWISKVKSLLEYITDNYKQLPKYILYLDCFDCLILNDIKNIENILQFYDCKVLFNYEAEYNHTGADMPNINYYDKLYSTYQSLYGQLNFNKYGVKHTSGLNAGAFIGEKKYIKKILEIALKYMLSATKKEFPYGCMDDQLVLRYVHNNHFDIMSIDYYNLFFYWGLSIDYIEEFPNYEMGYTDKYLYKYLSKKLEI